MPFHQFLGFFLALPFSKTKCKAIHRLQSPEGTCVIHQNLPQMLMVMNHIYVYSSPMQQLQELLTFLSIIRLRSLKT